MLVEELAFAVPVNANVAVQTKHFTTPQLFGFRGIERAAAASFIIINTGMLNELLKRRTTPQSLRERTIINLVAIIHPNGVSSLRLAGCGGQR